MNVGVAFKVVFDDQDIQIRSDGSLDYTRAKYTVSTYDLNALEAAAQLAAAHEGSRVVAITVGPSSIDDSKLKKNVLARGVDELYMVADDGCQDMDAFATAAVLADACTAAGPFDVVLCGDGSADLYAQQVGVQLAAALDTPVVTAVSSLSVQNGVLRAERVLEDVVQTVEVELPVIAAVIPDAATPRIPGMKDILAAGKKPMTVVPAEQFHARALETVSVRASERADRALVVLDASSDGAVEQFASAIKAAL